MKQTQTQIFVGIVSGALGLVLALSWILMLYEINTQLRSLYLQSELDQAQQLSFQAELSSEQLDKSIAQQKEATIQIVEEVEIEPPAVEATPMAITSSEQGSTNSPPEIVSQPTTLETWGLSRAYSISIPSLGIRAPVMRASTTHWNLQEWNQLEEQLQTAMSYGAVAYPHSASAKTEGGSLYIAAHSSPPDQRAMKSNYGHLFATLPSLQSGEEIVLQQGTENIRYRMSGARAVPASYSHVLAEGGPDSLTLITCYPVGSTDQRWIVTAKKVIETSEL